MMTNQWSIWHQVSRLIDKKGRTAGVLKVSCLSARARLTTFVMMHSWCLDGSVELILGLDRDSGLDEGMPSTARFPVEPCS